MKNTLALLFLLLVVLPLSVSAAETTVTVPPGVYALLHFDQPVTSAMFPPHSPLDGKPMFMAGRKAFAVRLAADNKQPVELVVELSDGRAMALMLKPQAGSPAEVDVPGSEFDRSAQRQAPSVLETAQQQPRPEEDFRSLYGAVLHGQSPEGWQRQDRPALPTLNYDRLTASPFIQWTEPDGATVLIGYRLTPVGDSTATVDPSQFYQPGVLSTLLTDNVVAAGHHPLLYVIVKHDEQVAP